MKTKTINLYEYHELPEDVKEKVLQDNRYINVEDSWWYEAVYEGWKEKLEAEGFKNPVISFSGFYSQGDGASFTAEVDVKEFCKANKSLTRFKPLLALVPVGDLSANIIRIDRHYSHWNTVRADCDMACTNETDKLIPLQNELESFLTERVRDLSREIYRDLEKEYEYMTSDEAIIDTLEANEYTFRENGEIEHA